MDYLPLEVLRFIIKEVSNIHDLLQLCIVSKTFYSATIPELYTTILIRADDEECLHMVKVKHFLQNSGRMKHVRNLQVRSPFYVNRPERCIHNWDMIDMARGSASIGNKMRRIDKLSASLLAVLDLIRESELRSFSWEIGTCIRPQILGPTGYLNSKQNKLAVINLVTMGMCEINERGNSPIELGQFSCPRDISWIGVWSDRDLAALNTALKTNANHLRRLELDFVNMSLDPYKHSYLASRILELPVDQCKVRFPSLRALSLSSVSLEASHKELAYALNIHKLSSLTLRNCPGWEVLLTSAMERGHNRNLSSIEVVYHRDTWKPAIPILMAFFWPAPCLKDLFVSLSFPGHTFELWNVAKNQSGLTRFVYHEKTWQFRESGSDDGDLEVDNINLSLSTEDVKWLTLSGPEHPFAGSRSECLGLSCDLMILKPIVAPFATSLKFKILHVRRFGEGCLNGPRVGIYETNNGNKSTLVDSLGSTRDRSMAEILDSNQPLKQFANWVFGPDGLLSLRVLAFGDFSYMDRLRDSNHLLCRHSWSFQHPRTKEVVALAFRHVEKTDHVLWSLVELNKDFLGACPTEPIFEYWASAT